RTDSLSGIFSPLTLALSPLRTVEGRGGPAGSASFTPQRHRSGGRQTAGNLTDRKKAALRRETLRREERQTGKVRARLSTAPRPQGCGVPASFPQGVDGISAGRSEQI